MRTKVRLITLFGGILLILPPNVATGEFGGAGSGTETDPYIITNVQQLQEMNEDLDAWYVLENDIDASDTKNWNSGKGFEPVGNLAHPFTGHFDGRGYTITGLYINRLNTDYVGLFGQTSAYPKRTVIKNVSLANADIGGGACVGGLVGRGAYRTIIENSYCRGTVSGVDWVGGVAGVNYMGMIANCYSAGNISGDDGTGGLIGKNAFSDIWASGSSANVTSEGIGAGGLGGENYFGVIRNSYSIGNLSGTYRVGGLVGYHYGSSTITNSYSAGAVNGSQEVGGLVGYNYGANCHHSFWDMYTTGQNTSACGTGKTTAEMKQKATFTNWDFDTVWDIVEGQSYPFLRGVGGQEPPENQPPSVSNPNQFWSDGETVILVGRKTDESTVVLKGQVSDPDNDRIKLQIELRRLDEYDGKFLNEPTQQSDFVESGGEATITVYGLVYGNYHWQGRAVDEKNLVSEWIQFGGNDILDKDFVLTYMTLPEKAAELAICLARRLPKVDYGWGKKGYDFLKGAFFAPKRVLELDCSGLVLWAYDRAYYPDGKVSWGEAAVTEQCEKTQGPVKCTIERQSPICWEGAAQQSQYNTIGISREELMVGDLIFMPKTLPYTSYDHIMIYVGDGKVVHSFYDAGFVVEDDLVSMEDGYPNVPVKYRRVARPELFISDDCPIDLIVTDPDGLVISKVMCDIPGSEYYEHEVGDGEIVNVIAIAFRKVGDYTIRVVPEPSALPTDTYNLGVTLGDERIILAENVQIKNIPAQTYIIRSTENEIIPIIPSTIDFDPDTLSLKGEGKWVTVYVELPVGHGYDVSDINVSRTFLEGLLEVQRSDIQDGVMMVKFDRQDVIAYIELVLEIELPADVTLMVTGELNDGTPFEGSDTIRVIDEGGEK